MGGGGEIPDGTPKEEPMNVAPRLFTRRVVAGEANARGSPFSSLLSKCYSLCRLQRTMGMKKIDIAAIKAARCG
jgi:hypothetical protein